MGIRMTDQESESGNSDHVNTPMVEDRIENLVALNAALSDLEVNFIKAQSGSACQARNDESQGDTDITLVNQNVDQAPSKMKGG
jgi:hypothetical protein